MSENWRLLAGYPGYEVSDQGRVRSLPRIITRIRCSRTERCFYKGRVLRQGRARNGYLTVSLSGRSVNVHTAVLLAFVGPPPPGHQAAHDSGVRQDNRQGNLKWATPKENTADRYRHGTVLFGTRHPLGRKTHCLRGHPFDGSRRADGRRACATCQRDRKRRANGTHPSRFRTPVEPRLTEGLRLVAAGMPITRAAQIAKIGRKTLARGQRSGTCV
jgi:hypothetical protein